MSQPAPSSSEWTATAASGARRALLLLAALGLLAAPGVLAWRYQQPRWYYAEAEIENLHPEEGWNGPLNALSFPAKFEPPLQVLRRTVILDPVIDELNLTQVHARQGVRPTKQEVYNRLRACLRIEAGPQFARIGVYEQDPARAADCANAVAMTYVSKRNEEGWNYLERYRAANAGEVEKQRPLVRAAAEEAQRIRERDGVTDLDPEHRNAGDEQAPEDYRQAKASYLREKALLDDAVDGVATFQTELEQAQSAVRLRQRAEPARRPLPWWRGAPRRGQQN